MYKDLNALGEKSDQGFFNLQIFLENFFFLYFSKSNEDKKIPSNKANISSEQKGLKINSENYEDNITFGKKIWKKRSKK